MSGSSGGSTVSLSDGTTGGTSNITRPQEPPPPTPVQDYQQKKSPHISQHETEAGNEQTEEKGAARIGGIENPGFEEDDDDERVGNGGSIFISVSAPSPGLDTSMLSERTDKEVAEAVNLELVSMNPFSTNGVNGIPVKKDGGDQAGLSDGYADAYDEYFVPVNEHRKYMRGEKLYVTKDKRRSQSWRRCICWGIGFVLLSVAILIAVLAGTGVILSQESQTLVTEKAETGRQLGSSGSDGPWTGGRSELPPLEASSFTPPPPSRPNIPSMPTTDMSQLYVPQVLEGELVIDSLQFDPTLSISGSEEFQKLANSLEKELQKALFDVQTLNYGAADIFVKVVEFSAGSVVVKFRVGWEFKEGIKKAPDPVDKDALRQRLERQLNLNGGVLGTYHIPTGTIRSRRLLDACQFNNGECSHDCAFDYRNSMAFVCTCPTGLHLDASGKNCTDLLTTDAIPTHNHEPVPEPLPEPSPEPSPEPEPEPERTSSTTMSSDNMNHQVGPIPEHTTLDSQQSRHPEVPTTQPPPSYHQEHLGQPDDIPVTVETALSELANVSADQTHEIALDSESPEISSPQRENKTRTLHVVEGNSTEISENSAKYLAEVPASVQVIYDDTAHTERDVHSLPHDGDILESTSSPHLHTETQTLTVSVIDGNHSQTTHGPYKMTDSPVGIITRHELNESIVAVSSQSPESRDRSSSETSASLLDVFMPSEEMHAAATTGSPGTSQPTEYHMAASAGTSAMLSENEAEPTEKKRGFVYASDGNRFKAGKKSEIAGSLGNSAEDPVVTSRSTKMEINSSKFEVTDVPTAIPVSGHANMLAPSTDSVTKVLHGSHDETATVLPVDVPEGHKHDGVLSNDLYFPDLEHAENDTLLNALSPEDYDSHPLQPVTVSSRVAENVTALPNQNIKKAPRLDDDELFEVKSTEKNDHESTSEAASPVTETHVSDSEWLPPLSDNTSRPNIPAAEVREHGDVAFENVEHHLKTTNNSGDTSIAVDARDASQNITEPVIPETTPKSDEHNLSAVLKGAGSQVTTDDILAVSAMEDASVHMVEVPAITTENVDESVPVMRPEELPTHSTDITTVLEPESVTTLDSNLTSLIFVHDSSISSERDVSSPSRENVIEDSDSLHPGALNTTTDHPLTVAPLREAIPPRILHGDKALTEAEQPTDMTTQVESVKDTAEGVPNSVETSTASLSNSPVTQSAVQTLQPDDITAVSPSHEENDISSGGEPSRIPGDKHLDVTQPENATQDGEMRLAPLNSDSETRAGSADEEDMGHNVTVGRQTDSPPLHMSSSEEATPTTSPEEIRMNQTEGMMSATTEVPLESDNEAQGTASLLGKPGHEHLNTVKPLPQNISSMSSEYKSITEYTLLSTTNRTDGNSHGDSEQSNAVFEKPHPFADIENRLLVESGKVHDMSTSSTTEYANEIHALHPSGGGNVIAPTAPSVLLVDPVQTPTSMDILKNETFSTITAESNSAVEHAQQGKNSTAPKVEKDVSIVSIKKKDFLTGSAVNKKALKPTSEMSSPQADNEQSEKKATDKLQKFDKDNSKKIDKMGFAALPVSIEEFDPNEDVNVSIAMSTPPAGMSMTETSSSAEEESRPVDEEDENEDPLVQLRSDVEHINVVEPKGEKKSDAQRIKASRYEGGMAATGEEHILARSDAIGVGVEPAVSLVLTGDLQTPRILHDSDTVVPLRTKNESLSPSTASNEEKATVGNFEDSSTVSEVPSSSVILQVIGNSTETNHNDGKVVTTPEEGSDLYALTTEPSVDQSIYTDAEAPAVPAVTVVTLNSEDLAKLHKGMNASLDNGDPHVNATFIQVTEDTSPAGHSNGVKHQWTPENGTAVGGNVVEEVPVAFSKCASGQFQCVNGTSHEGAYCVSQVAKCDSVKDCSDASDETGCIEEGCPGNFQCSSGQCLKRHLVCNGIVDCNDGSDEVNCEMWQCQFDELQCPSGRCIPLLWRCDGKPDCDNHTDEYNCMSSCGNDEYLCSERWCIPMAWRCNGVAECANGEDEKLCDCSLDQFRCNTGGCVPKIQVCDAVEHCPDMSDEWGCVRLHDDTMNLEIRSAEGTWHPVCGDGWDSNWSDLACQSLGYSKAIFTEKPAVSDTVSQYYALKPGTAAPLEGASSRLTSSLYKPGNESSCISGTIVEVSCQEFTCGSHGLADGVAARLVGGDGATNGQWPSVSLLYHTRHRSSCTASIISPRWLLSSYSCLHLRDKMLNADSWVAFGGGSMFETDKPETQIREVRSIIPYPQVKYNQFLYNNDIALIELSQPLMFTRYVGAICLPEKEIEPRQLCVTAGWGYTTPGEINFSQYLHYLPVPTIDLRDCNSTKHYAGFITQDEICAGFTDAEKSPCYNDEGAPLMCVSEGGVWELQGVLSYHSNCGQGYHPSIFSSITAVRGWVQKTVGTRFERKSTFNVRRRRRRWDLSTAFN